MPAMEETKRNKVEGPSASDSGEKQKPIDLSKEQMPKIDRAEELQKLNNPKKGLE